MDVWQAIISVYPKAVDCLKGHIGPIKEHLEFEIDDDRYYEIKVPRCEHCNMPTGGETYV